MGFLALAIKEYPYWALTVRLSQYKHYPSFMVIADSPLLDRVISSHARPRQLSSDDLAFLWKALWIKKDNAPAYISETLRKVLVRKVSWALIRTLRDTYLQIDLLKYKLGINDNQELRRYLGEETPACRVAENMIENVHTDNLFEVSTYFDVVHFCKLSAPVAMQVTLGQLLQKTRSFYSGHVREHGIHDVPVYVNDCSQAADENERYHCLFFQQK